MKKIVALVLSLVMALSLCTVAFAAVDKTTGTALYGLDANKNVAELVQEGGIESVKERTNPDGSGFIAHYSIEWAANVTVSENGTRLIPCEQADAKYAIYKNGAFVDWVFVATEDDTEYVKAVVAQAATTAKPNCTTSQFFEDGFVADGRFYVESDSADSIPVKADGKLIRVIDVTTDRDYVIWASHIFAKGVKNASTGYDVATCLICKGEFACTNNEAVATKNGYKISTGFEYKTADANNVYEANKYENGYDFAWGQTYADNYKFCWQLKAGTTEEIGTADKTETPAKGVESAKTFDAGIAMYVGMSLMSVAGTAAVIGKKKEF